MLIKRYESISFETAHKPILDLVPASHAWALDIGSGSGRDSIALANRGLKVIGAEPSDDMRAFAEQRHDGKDVLWLEDALPNLTRVRRIRNRFDFILVSAVWMHLDCAERREAMNTIAEMMEHNAVASISLRRGPTPGCRRMFRVSVEGTLSLAARSGLTVLRCVEYADPLGRQNVKWRHVCITR